MTVQSEQPIESSKSGAMQQADTTNGEGAPETSRDSSSRTSASPRVLLAVDDSDHSVRAAKVAHQLFGSDAKYFVINVGPMDVMMAGGDPMTWGVPYPMVMPFVGHGMAVAPFRGDEVSAAD
ncbi:MAG: hypothetical protein ABMA25_13305, partial [Ilumatobacteraceae bacterium]